MENTKNKIWFLHLLRGVACLMVLYSHIFQLFWIKYNDLKMFWQGSDLLINVSDVFICRVNEIINNFHVQFRMLGVALFFLISGFVIPISLEKTKGIPFLIQRMTRIYPVYVIGLLILSCSMLVYCFYTKQHWQYGLKSIILNASLFKDWSNVPTMDGINWTLEIELKFYILMAFLVQFFNIKNARIAIIIGLVFLILKFLTFILTSSFWSKPAFIINFNIFFLTYMLIGTGYYNFYKRNLSLKKLLFYIVTMVTICFVCMFRNQIFTINILDYYINYSLALLIFTIVYLIKERLAYNRVLNCLANISYPLYVVHGFNSYILMTVLYKYIHNYYICTSAALVMSLLLAYILHLVVELPSIAFGKKLSTGYSKLIVTACQFCRPETRAAQCGDLGHSRGVNTHCNDEAI